jgi:hypothetical protein
VIPQVRPAGVTEVRLKPSPKEVWPGRTRQSRKKSSPGVKMSNDDFRKQTGIARLAADLRAAKIELLSAQCATDRLRLQYTLEDIVSFGERHALEGAIASADAMCRFFSSIADQLNQGEQQK